MSRPDRSPARRPVRPALPAALAALAASAAVATTAALAFLPAVATAEPVPVEVVRAGDGWQLLRGGEPYVIRGGGGRDHLEELVAAGGNSIRTWGVGEETAALLDRAHELGLTVSLGIWLGHERHGFDYGDSAQVAEQLENARAAVLEFRDHPALLLWGVGNEMEGFESGDNPRVWEAVCDVARMVQELDPHHPVMTTTADIGGGRVPSVHACDALDIHGVNSYGGAPSLPQRHAEAGGTLPIVLTEYGPRGTWEVPFTDFGSPPEETSTQKAASYRDIWMETVEGNSNVLGGYAFLWGWKIEATATWFGLFLPDGTRLAGVDALTEAWGRTPANRVPVVTPLEMEGGPRADPGAVVRVAWDVRDPEGDPLETTWELRRELDSFFTGGDAQALSPRMPDAVLESAVGHVKLRLPETNGVYRLYATVRDGHGGGANASLPMLVGEPRAEGDPLPLPWWVYQDAGIGGPWVPSGWMGATDGIAMDFDWTENPASAPHCIRVHFDSPQWGGVVWQYPANDWGEKPEAMDLRGARHLSFKVRADFEIGEITFGVGILGADKPYPDSMKAEKRVKLRREWTDVRIPLKGDLSGIKSGFWWVAPVRGTGDPFTFYLDDIVFE